MSHDNLKYECERNHYSEPSIVEMTLNAIELLRQNRNGYFLLVEGGRIDHGHHESKLFLEINWFQTISNIFYLKDKARKALDDFVVFDEAIGEALKTVDEKDTMVVVTADHSHTFSIGGNSLRGNQVLGI